MNFIYNNGYFMNNDFQEGSLIRKIAHNFIDVLLQKTFLYVRITLT